MIRIGDVYADESTPGGALRVRSILCTHHGAVAAARLVMSVDKADPGFGGAVFGRMELCCAHCPEVVRIMLYQRPALPGEVAAADMPITRVPSAAAGD